MRPKKLLFSWILVFNLLIAPLNSASASAEIESPKNIDVISINMAGRSPTKSVSTLVGGISNSVIPNWKKQGINFELGQVEDSPLQIATPL